MIQYLLQVDFVRRSQNIWNKIILSSPRAEMSFAERELRGKQVQVLRGPATVTDELISDTTESTACAEAFGKVKAAFEFPARIPA